MFDIVIGGTEFCFVQSGVSYVVKGVAPNASPLVALVASLDCRTFLVNMKMFHETFHNLDDISDLRVGREYEYYALLACILCAGKELGIATPKTVASAERLGGYRFE